MNRRNNNFPKSQADLAQTAGKNGGSVNVPDATRMDTLARVPSALRWRHWWFYRHLARAAALRKETVEFEEVGRTIPEWLGPLDATLAAGFMFVLSYGLSGAALEFGGSRASLAVWSTTLGGAVPTSLIAAGLGLILVLIGHAAGHMAEAAMHAKSTFARCVLPTLAVLALAGGYHAIGELGGDRQVNLNASGKLAEAGLLGARAQTLERSARDTDARAAASDSPVLPPATSAGNRLRDEAAGLESQAAELKRQAMRERRLKSFTWVQRAALIVAFIGGFLWSAGSVQRTSRRFSRRAGRAEAIYTGAFCKFVSIAALNERSVHLGGHEPTGDFDTWTKQQFQNLFGHLPGWCSSSSLPTDRRDRDLPDNVKNLDDVRPDEDPDDQDTRETRP